MEKIKIYGPPVMMLALTALLAFFWNLSHRARVSAEHDAEQARLALKGVVVAADETDKELRSGIEKLLAENDLLRRSYEQARTAAPGAQPRATAHLNTKSFEVKCQIPDGTGAWLLHPCEENSPVAAGEGQTSTPLRARPEPVAACVLREGDEGSVEATIITLETREKNLIIAGTAEFYRDAPPPRIKVGEGPFTAALSDVAALASRPEPRWGVLAAGLCTAQGCGLGAGVLLPPWSFWGLRVETQAVAYVGPVLSASVGVGVRW